MSITNSIYQVIKNNTEITSLLSTYKDLPSVFTVEPIPDDVKEPYIIISQNISAIPNDTKTTQGKEITRDIRMYSKSRSLIEIENIAEKVRKTFHRKNVFIEGHKTIICNVTGPLQAPSGDEEIQGLILTINLILEEEI